MTLIDQTHRPLGIIAEDILSDDRLHISSHIRAKLHAMARLRDISDEAAYRTVARARLAMNGLRSSAATRIKRELETLLCHYRADQW